MNSPLGRQLGALDGRWSFDEVFPEPVGFQAKFATFRDRHNAAKFWSWDRTAVGGLSPRRRTLLGAFWRILKHYLDHATRSIRRFLDQLKDELARSSAVGPEEAAWVTRHVLGVTGLDVAPALMPGEPVDPAPMLATEAHVITAGGWSGDFAPLA